MKIRCGSHQQNRSIVRPGLSLMAAKVALTAEEFRENSQRSIDLFNTEKLSTDSTRVLKSVYCNSVHFCRCNLHGACGGKGPTSITSRTSGMVAICTERVEAKSRCNGQQVGNRVLQSARSVWRQRHSAFVHLYQYRCNLHGACGGKGGCPHACQQQKGLVAICTERVEAKKSSRHLESRSGGCNLHGACGGKEG